MSSWEQLLKIAKSDSELLETPDRIITSFTDAQPLKGWTEAHAFREIWQNFRDGLKQRFGEEIFLLQEDSEIFTAYHKGEKVGQLDISNKNKLEMIQNKCYLTLETLQMASSKKNQIGGHGEGFKVGINILLRKGYKVTYFLPFQKWEFTLENVYSKSLRNLVVTRSRCFERDSLIIEIDSGTNESIKSLFDPWTDLQLTPGARVSLETKNGQILFYEDPQFYGRVYCRGLYVNIDPELAKLKIAVNLNIQVSRDRHLIPYGSWKTISQIIDEGANNYLEEKVSSLFEHLVFTFFEYKREEVSSQASHLKEPIRKYFSKSLKVPLNNIIFIERDNTKNEKLLSSFKKKTIVGGALADPLDLEKIQFEFINSSSDVSLNTIKSKNFDIFQKFIESLRINVGNIDLKVKDIPKIDCLPDVILKNGKLVVTISKEQVSQETEDEYIFSDLFYPIMTEISRYLPRERRKFLYQIHSDIMQKKYNFVPTKIEINQPEKEEDQLTKIGNYFHNNNNNNNDNNCVQKEIQLERSSNDRNLFRNSSLRDPMFTDPCLKHSNYKHKNDLFNVNVPSTNEESTSLTCVFNGQLIETNLGNTLTIFVQVQFLSILCEDLELKKKIIENHGQISRLIQVIRYRVGVSLNIPTNSLNVVEVLIESRILGFYSEGGIYINLLPLLNFKSEIKLKSSIFFTFIHELCHRAHTNHGTDFADQMAVLVYLCRNVLDDTKWT